MYVCRVLCILILINIRLKIEVHKINKMFDKYVQKCQI